MFFKSENGWMDGGMDEFRHPYQVLFEPTGNPHMFSMY